MTETMEKKRMEKRKAVNIALGMEVTDDQWWYLQNYWQAFTLYADSCVYAGCIDTIKYELETATWK